ncbi:SH3 domain-containing protein [Roseomonas sp. USHLN139]|uniref:SH3 domain-containing protein n=1 Tax=Roseomonas sp. USHLN139 TaxID=3081298 RepID=UPI003B013414
MRQLETELPKHLAARDAAFRRVARASTFPLNAFIGWRLPALRSRLAAAERKLEEAVARRNGSWTSLHFAFRPSTLEAFRNLALAFRALGTTRAIWVTTSTAEGTVAVPVLGAVLQRQAVKPAPALPPHVESDWPGLAFRHSGGGLELYPGFAMVSAKADTKAVSLLDVRLDTTSTVVAENIDPPADATLVTRVWEKANKDGSPDRRYANNRSIAIVRYGLVRFSAPGIAATSYLVSNPELAHRFATAFTELQRCIAAEESSLASVPPAPRGEPRVAPFTRAPASVPPPPSVGRAHEYTVGALVAGAISVWLLIMGQLGGELQATASGSGAPFTQASAPPQTAVAPTGRVEVNASPTTPSTTLPEPTSTSVDTVAANPPPKEATAPERERIVVRAGGANIRSAPNGSADVLRTTSGGTRLNVFGRSGGWVRVGEADAWGWVHSSLLEGGN